MGAVDVYAFSMIAFELFEGWPPFVGVHPVDAARRASLHNARPQWGKVNRCAPAAGKARQVHIFCVWWRALPRCTLRARGGAGSTAQEDFCIHRVRHKSWHYQGLQSWLQQAVPGPCAGLARWA